MSCIAATSFLRSSGLCLRLRASCLSAKNLSTTAMWAKGGPDAGPGRGKFQAAGQTSSYMQGQYSDDGKREYFYFVDHQGMLFLTETKMKNFTSCFKDMHFLRFFFKRVRRNYTNRYFPEFPFVSLCGEERNFLMCDDTPVVFTALADDDSEFTSSDPLLTHNHGGPLLTFPFSPAQLCVVPETGRIYHPASENSGGFGLVADKLAMRWTQEKRFIYADGRRESDDPSEVPLKFLWRDVETELTHELTEKIRNRPYTPAGRLDDG